MSLRVRASVAAVAAALASAATAGAAGPSDAVGPRVPAATDAPVAAHAWQPTLTGGATVAKVVVPSLVRHAPDDPHVVYRAPTRTAWSGGPQWLLVLGRAVDTDGVAWLRVELPVRPNEASGWIRADRVLLRDVPWFVRVSTARRLVSVFRDGRLVRRFRAVVGAPATPTPHGLFALLDPIRQTGADGFLGTWALHLSALSNVLDDYGGGPGRIALHGRGGASLADPLGTARSHGCIRLDNDAVDWLARTLPRGTPVRIA